MLVFKYLLRVFKHLTIAYNNYPVKKICIVINYCAHIRLYVWLFRIIRRSKTHVKSIDSLQYVTEIQMSVNLSIYSVYDWPVSNVG